MKLDQPYPEILEHRYQVIAPLGQGGMGTTYKALDLSSSTEVAIKVISLRQAGDWKILELFEREAQILASLDHPFIPRYLDYFEVDTDRDRHFYLVQELVPGTSLAQLVEDNWTYDLATISQIASQLLTILQYLHKLTPPVIHRDIKPENILRKPDGSIYLVDFGSVQSVYRNPNSYINTFVGTLGYMAPEQFSGQVSPASDLYSLGCTLLFLLTKRSPAELPVKRLKIDFRSVLSLQTDWAAWLDQILEPAMEDRFQSAQQALLSLPSPQPKTISTPPLIQPPTTSPTLESSTFLQFRDNTLFLHCPPSNYFQPSRLEINGSTFLLTLSASGVQHSLSGPTSALAVSIVKKECGTGHSNLYCVLYDGSQFHRFADTLTSSQQQELVQSIDDFLFLFR